MFPTRIFVDPTIPGISIRDLQEKPVARITTGSGPGPAILSTDLKIRRALSDLDSEALRDIGFDRAAA